MAKHIALFCASLLPFVNANFDCAFFDTPESFFGATSMVQSYLDESKEDAKFELQ